MLLQQREAEHDIGGGERLPVRPFHARADGERQRLVVRAPLVVAREPGRLLVVQEVVVDERLVQGAEGLAVHRAVVRIEVALPQRTALVVDRQHAPDCLLGVVVVARRTTSAGARQQRERRQGADEKVASSHSFPPECPIIPRARDVQLRSACPHTAAFCACRAGCRANTWSRAISSAVATAPRRTASSPSADTAILGRNGISCRSSRSIGSTSRSPFRCRRRGSPPPGPAPA